MLLVGVLFGWLVLRQPAVGTVEGVVLLPNGNPLRGADVVLAQGDFGAVVRTDRAGRFVHRGVPVGAVQVSAGSRYHQAKSVKVMVGEARVVRVRLPLRPNMPALSVTPARRTVYASAETPRIPISGYARDARIELTLWRLDPRTVLGRATGLAELQRMQVEPEVFAKAPPPGLPMPAKPFSVQTVDFGKPDREGYIRSRVPIPIPKGRKGLWMIRARYGTATVHSWLLVTDLALVVKRPPEKSPVLAYAVDMTRGTPIAGATIARYRNGKLDAPEVATNAQGLAWVAPCRAADGENEIIVGWRGDDAAFLGMFNWSDSQGASGTVVSLQTDRPLYRPGHRIHYKGTVRQRPDPADPYRYTLPTPRNVDVVLRDALGAEIGKARLRSTPQGTFHGSFATSTEGPTGGYSLEAKVDGKVQVSYVSVSTYRKPDFDVVVRSDRPHYLSGEMAAITVEGKYFHGASAAGAKVEWHAYTESDWASEQLDDVDDEVGPESVPWESGGWYGGSVAGGSAVLDAQGRWSARIPTVEKPSDYNVDEAAPQARWVTVVANVTDVSGRMVSEEVRFRVTTSPWLVTMMPDGMLAEPGKPSNVVAVVRDIEGKRIAGAKVRLEALRIQQTPVSYVEDDPDTYDGVREKRERIGAIQENTTGPDGQVRFAVVPNKIGAISLQAQVAAPDGRTSQTSASLFAVGDRDTDTDLFTNELTVATDRREYAVGESARILIGAKKTGQTVLLTVEGDRVHRAIPVRIQGSTTVVRLPLPEAYGPNITVAACQIKDASTSDSSVVLRVRMPRRTLRVDVVPKKPQAQPGELVPVVVRVRDADGKPVRAEFSLAVVDEALLALRDYDAREMLRTFFPRRWNSVLTVNSFTTSLLGGDDKGGPAITPRQRFLDTAYWKPDAITGPDGTARLSVPLPDNLTQWRFTVRATTLGPTMVGYGKGVLRVSKPLSLRLETPRVLGVGDRGRILAVVSNQTGLDQDIAVRLPAAGLFGVDDTVRTVRVAAGKTGTIEWPIAPSAPADMVLQATAWTSDRRFTDGVVARLPIRAFGRVVSGGRSGVLSGSGQDVDIDLVGGDIPGERSVVVRVTPGVGAPLAAAVEMLADYPYGCTEQTASRIVPIAKVFALDPGLLEAGQRASLRKLVDDGLARLRRFQHSSGGWGWWEYGSDDPFLTAYVLHGLLDLRVAGFAVPDSVLASAGDALLAMHKAGGKVGVYGLWAAFRAKRPGLTGPTMPKAPTVRDLAAGVLWQRELGADPGAWVQALRGRRKQDNGRVWWRDALKGEWLPDRSDRMDTALAIRALLSVDKDDPDAMRGVRWLLSERIGDGFGDTRDTAFTVDALCGWIRTHPGSRSEPTSVRVAVNGAGILLEGVSGERFARVPARLLKPGANRLSIKVSGTDPKSVFWSVASRQMIAASARRPLDPVVADGVTLGREYLVGDRVQDRFRAGDDVSVRLTVTTPIPLHHVLLEDPFPAGFEATERGTAEVEMSGTEWSEPWENVDVRDDRIALFFRRIEPGKHVFTVHLRAQSPGRYAVVPAVLTPMYRPQMRIESRSTTLEIAP